MPQCFDAITINPAKILGLQHFCIEVGRDASFVLLQAQNVVETLRLRAHRLMVWRRGVLLASSTAQVTHLNLAGLPVHTAFS